MVFFATNANSDPVTRNVMVPAGGTFDCIPALPSSTLEKGQVTEGKEGRQKMHH